MKIAQVAPLWVPVPPRSHGGTEYVVSLLTEELIRRGHEVTLFASGDSNTKGKLVSTCPRAIWRDTTLRDPHACIMRQMSLVAERASEFDIIHNHAAFYFAPFSRFFTTPVIQTIHRPFYPETHQLYLDLPNIQYVAISQDHATSGYPLKFKGVIHNGIPLDRYPFSQQPKDYMLFLSRISPDKGIIEAIEAAKLAGKKLIIAGNIVRGKMTGQDDYEFFVRRVKPRIDGQKVIYVGEAEFSKKTELMRGAEAFLFPIRRREPFGIAPVEALACGTPVIAFSEGSTSEIIENGKTGFIVKSIREMAERLKQIHLIDRAVCRKSAEEKFSHIRMVDQYESLYRDIINTKTTAYNTRAIAQK